MDQIQWFFDRDNSHYHANMVVLAIVGILVVAWIISNLTYPASRKKILDFEAWYLPLLQAGTGDKHEVRDAALQYFEMKNPRPGEIEQFFGTVGGAALGSSRSPLSLWFSKRERFVDEQIKIWENAQK